MAISYKTKREQKRGEGRGKDYIPWITVRDFSSRGNSSRVPGFKTGRGHHFLSKFEASLFYIFDLDETIEDIREQFPLLDIELAKELAEEAGMKYPPNRNDEVHVLTSDYCITYTDGREVVLTIKYLKDMNKRQLELFEIERRYWKEKGIQWKVVTEKEMPGRDLLKNYKDMHDTLRDFIKDSFSDEQIREMLECIFEHYETSSDLSLPEFAEAIDIELEIEPGSILRFIKVLIAKSLITTDLSEPLVTSKRKMKDLNFRITDARNLRKSDLAA